MLPKLVPSLLLFVLVAGSLTVFPSGMDIRVQHFTNFQFAALAALSVFVFFKVSKAIGALSFYAGFEMFRTVGFMTLSSTLLLLALFVILVETKERWYGKKGLLYDAILIVAAINLVFQVLQYFHIYPIVRPVLGSEEALVGLMANVDEAFALYMLAIPALLRRGRRLLLVPVGIGGLLVASPLVSSPTPYVVADHVMPRLRVWHTLIVTTKERLITGFGYVPFAIIDEKESFAQAHNEFVEWFFMGGIIGALLGAAFLYSCIRRGWQADDRIPLFGFLAACMSSLAFFTWHTFSLSLITVFYLGMVYSNKKEGFKYEA